MLAIVFQERGSVGSLSKSTDDLSLHACFWGFAGRCGLDRVGVYIHCIDELSMQMLNLESRGTRTQKQAKRRTQSTCARNSRHCACWCSATQNAKSFNKNDPTTCLTWPKHWKAVSECFTMLNPEFLVLVSNLASACAPLQIQMIQAPLLGPDLEMFHSSVPITIFNSDLYVLRILESADRSCEQMLHDVTSRFSRCKRAT